MGDRITKRQVLKHKADSLSEPEIAEVLDYINIMESLRDQASKPDLFDDELMNLLADALENRRARVVTEWDRVRRRADTRASSKRNVASPLCAELVSGLTIVNGNSRATTGGFSQGPRPSESRRDSATWSRLSETRGSFVVDGWRDLRPV